MTGLILTLVEPQQRTVANSLANLSYNLIGYLPSPLLYGFICEMTGGSTSRWGLTILMFSAIIAFFSVCAAFVFNGKITAAEADDEAKRLTKHRIKQNLRRMKAKYINDGKQESFFTPKMQESVVMVGDFGNE